MAASASISKTIYLGTFVHSVTLTELEIGEKGAIGVNEAGVIEFVERNVGLAHVHEKHESYKDAKVIELTGKGFYFPGFIGMSKSPPPHL
jgi:guanine deaminase